MYKFTKGQINAATSYIKSSGRNTTYINNDTQYFTNGYSVFMLDSGYHFDTLENTDKNIDLQKHFDELYMDDFSQVVTISQNELKSAIRNWRTARKNNTKLSGEEVQPNFEVGTEIFNAYLLLEALKIFGKQSVNVVLAETSHQKVHKFAYIGLDGRRAMLLPIRRKPHTRVYNVSERSAA